MKQCVLAVIFLVVMNCSDSSTGRKGYVRFSQMTESIETDGFEQSIATRRTVLIRLEKADRFIFDERPGLVNLNLEAKGLNGGSATVFPLGFAQFGVLLENEGRYELQAKEDGRVLDAIEVRSENLDAIRPHPIVEVSPKNGTCLHTRSLESLVLHRNQSIRINIVPTRENRPLVGHLGLQAKGSDFLEFNASRVMDDTSRPNQLLVSPKANANLDGEAEITVSEQGGQTTTIRFRTTNEDSPENCVPF